MAISKELFEAIFAEASRIEEDCTISSKSHFNAGCSWRRRNYWIGIPATIFATAISLAAVKNHPDIVTVLSITAAILTGLLTYLKPSEHSSNHKSAGDQYLALRNDTRTFRTIDLSTENEDKSAIVKIKVLAQRRNELNQSCPEIPEKDFKIALNGVANGEAKYEIDRKA